MQLNDVQVKALADRAREELDDGVLAEAYLSAAIGTGTTKTADVPPNGGRVKAPTPKRAPRTTTPESAAEKRTRTPRADSAELDERVHACLRAQEAPVAIGVLIKGTGLPRPRVQLSLKRLEAGGNARKNANGKRDTTYEAV